MSLPARITPKCCATCIKLDRRDPTGIAGVSPSAIGQCTAKRADGGKVPTAWRPWRHESNWCDQWVKRRER